RAEQEKQRAEQEKQRAEQEKQRAEQEKQRAEQEKQRAEQAETRAEQEKMEITKNLILNGMDNVFIAQITGFPLETIQKIRETETNLL
ncbi:MAG: hypothetical protein QM536_07940, partial [Chitinophagaceae bacterium]|nr:hypothetical protein [Chitinophagaceae bacterium]